MTNSYQPEDIAIYNESSLKALVRAIRLSQGQFRLILVRCNYSALRDRISQRLHELSPIPIREIILPESVTSLYATIRQELGNEQPQALMIFGLESVNNLSNVLVSSNYIREEFSKHFSFPLILWINDETQQRLLRSAPDLESWSTSVELKLSTDELLAFLQNKTNQILTDDSTTPHWICNQITLESWTEITSACQELQKRGQALNSELTASIEFIKGLDAYVKHQLDTALEHYQESLSFWQQTNSLQQQTKLLINIAICYYHKAEQNRAENWQYWQQCRHYLQQGLAIFEELQRPDLVAYHISKLCGILRLLKDWDELQIVAQKALKLHQTHGNSIQLAQDYGCLAEVALERSQWNEAIPLAQQALSTSQQLTDEAGLYWFILGRSQEYLGQVEAAAINLEKAKIAIISSLEKSREDNNSLYNLQVYIDVLKKLRSLYFNQGQYLKAFEIKQEQQSIEVQYGFLPFTGAVGLRPLKQVINSGCDQADLKTRSTERITVSGRGQDIQNLIKRLSDNQSQLIVIHGMSGVGKSSLLGAGLVPALKEQAIGERNVLPVVLRRVVYSNWERELGRLLGEKLGEMVGSSSFDPPQPPLLRGENQNQIESPPFQGGLGGSIHSAPAIIKQLRKNNDRNLLTVLIFDQFEEFFFTCTDLAERRKFYEFLQVCLNIPFVKVILALREDYLHYLLECDRFTNLDVINNNILDKNIRYHLGDFAPERAKSVILELIARSQFYLEPELIDALVRDLAGEVGEVRPIELQVVGAQLQADNITTLEQYHQLGANPKEKLVQHSLEEVVKDCGQENEQAARLVLYLLTNDKGTRPLKTREELVADLKLVGFEAEIDKLDLVLEVLVGSGLVFEVPEAPANLYQLVHDYLVLFIRASQQAGEVEERKKEKEQRLLAEAKLNQVLKRQLRLALAAGGVFVILAAVAGTFGLQSYIGKTNAQINALSSSSNALFASDNPEDALIEALKAGGQLNRSFGVEPAIKTQVVVALQQAFYSLIARERQTLKGHNAEVNSVSWSPDGKTLASASKDSTIKLWSRDGKLLQTLKGHNDRVLSISWSPDGKTLASASGDKTIKLWSRDGKLLQTLKGHKDWVTSVSWSPDGNTLASASGDGTIKIWSLDGKFLQTLTGHKDWAFSVSWSPEGKTLASASGDGTIKLWSRDGKLLQTLTGHKDWVTSVSWSPDGNSLASASRDNTIKLWNRDDKPLQTFTVHNAKVNSISWSSDGRTLASASYDKTIKLWNRDGKLLQTLTGHNDWVTSVSWSPDGNTLASASKDSTIKLWSLDGKLLQTLTGHNDWVTSVSWSPDGNTLASASLNNTMKLWNRDGKLLQTLKGHNSGVSSVSWNPDGNSLVSASGDKTIKLWSRDGKLRQTLTGHNDGVKSVSWSPDGNTLASTSRDKTIKLWSRYGTLLQTLKGHNSEVTSVSWSRDGNALASASLDNTIKLWSRDGKPLQTLKGHNSYVYSVSWSPDGNTLASASGDKTVILWNLDLEKLTSLGCDWLKYYLPQHPETLKELPDCQKK